MENFNEGGAESDLKMAEYYLKRAAKAIRDMRAELGAIRIEGRESDFFREIEELARWSFDWESPAAVPMTVTEILVALGYEGASKSQKNACGAAMRKILGRVSRKSNGRRVFDMPPLKR